MAFEFSFFSRSFNMFSNRITWKIIFCDRYCCSFNWSLLSDFSNLRRASLTVNYWNCKLTLNLFPLREWDIKLSNLQEGRLEEMWRERGSRPQKKKELFKTIFSIIILAWIEKNNELPLWAHSKNHSKWTRGYPV